MAKVFHASYSGYFPFCIKPIQLDPSEDNRESGDGTKRPIQMSLKNAMRFFWIIKEVVVEVNGNSWTLPVVQALWQRDYEPDYANLKPGDFIERQPISEDEIVCSKTASIEITESNDEFDFNFTFFVNEWILNDNFYYPIFQFYFEGYEDNVIITSRKIIGVEEFEVIDFLGLGNIQFYRTEGATTGNVSFKTKSIWKYD